MKVEEPQTFDLHTHHYRCGHATGDIEDYIKAAIDNGLDIIGISDHSPHFYSEENQLYPRAAMGKSAFQTYIKEVLHLREMYEDKIEVLLGIEADYLYQHMDSYRAAYEKYPFDYIIGSVHSVDYISIFNKKRWNGLTNQEKTDVKDRYYHLIEQSARSGLYQILGHIDAMKGFYPEFSKIQSGAVEQTLKVIGQQELTIEVNTSGKTKDCGGWYPADELLERALFYGVDITFGSDAHTPQRVGEDFHLVRKKLKEIGFKKWCFFRQKEKVYISL